MSAIDAEGDSEELGVLAGIRAAYDPVYAPLLVAGTLAQLAGVVLGLPVVALVGFVVGAGADLATADERNAFRGRLRRFGLGLLQRVTYRAILLLALLVPAGTVALEVAGAYVVAFLVLGLATRGTALALLKALREQPATGELNLGEDLALHGFFPALRARRVVLVGLLAGAELAFALGLVLADRGSATAGLVVLGVTVAVLTGVTVAVVVWARGFRRSGAVDRYVADLEAAIAATGARTVLYFSGDRESTYQLNQWLPVVEQLDEPVLVLLRERGHLSRMLPTRHPVLVCRRHRDVEVALACDPLVVLYVATAGRNIHFLRYARPKHVFLNHGDSDKISSANPVVKVYDRLFVAGPLAIDRYRDAGIDLADDRFLVVGRPQLDGVLDQRRRIGDGPPTLLYAPTWEGFFDAADYSSLERSGEDLIRTVLREHPDVRIVFKPHPASGTVRPAARAARARIETLLREAGPPHLLADDDPSLDLLAWFDRADVLVSDISAVVTDFLATDKPYLVTNPRGLDRDEFRARFPSHHAAYVVDADLGDVGAQLTAALGDDPLAADRRRMKARVLGEHPDGALAAFTAALATVAADADRDAARVVNTFAYDR